ncbi:N-acetyl sugar amidotransferase [Flavisolibacter ginsenosidimutans]|uniref:N-acetyl sugar amidotransferase n=1 Tax=Flavisolibacter ginsenosidimutans TaxID=661481 RepID=A0A5B8UED9_9BACT|nr:N-acetyl sugar amidotransferase [Flavisolibacter ginsenosidimutans]QEC54878.1 N-acetyl sugar amidotransferase [Flavisolibacter ginsenosidimutans]
MKTEKTYQQCSLSVMDTIADPDIRFDENGVCTYYQDYLKAEAQHVKKGEEGKRELERYINEIKEDGKGKPYDCIIGLSGGVDSTYVAYLCKQYGLRPLAVHFDNGWNSELAVKNIENIVSRCGFDLYTLVVDWEEFKDIQLSYLKASVVDIEVVSDHAIFATLLKLCLKHNIHHSLIGRNIYSEFLMPKSWLFNKSDHVNLLDIHKQFGTKKLKTYPLNDTLLKKRVAVHGISELNILDYVDYNKAEAKKIIAEQLGWQDYGGKHYESLFTKFYQAYILPEKFKIDKRKAHLSTLIFAGQMTKAAALEELKKPLYRPEEFAQEKDFVLKKFGLTEEAWQKIMQTPPRSHYDFATEQPLDHRYPWMKPIKKTYRYFFPVK